MISTQTCSARRGFSLIEVAIALVIFVIGALAIIRIFPGALSVIRNNGDQQIATNLNRGLQVRLKTQNTLALANNQTSDTKFSAVPDATFNNSNANGSLSVGSWSDSTPSANHSSDFRDVASSVIGIPRFNSTLPSTQEIETGNTISALSRYRAILGEQAQPIQLRTPNLGDALYVTTQFPISVQPQPNAAVPVPVKPIITQDYVLNDVRVSPNGTLDFSRARVDNSDDISISPIGISAGSMLYVSYRYYNTNGDNTLIWGARDQPLSVPNAIPDLRQVQTIRVTPTRTGFRDSARTTNGLIVDAIVPEVVSVRLRQYVGQGEFGPDSSYTAIQRVAEARRGLVRLPTFETGTIRPSVNPVAEKPINVDYIADWSLLMQDGPVLQTPSAQVGDLPTLPAPPSPDTRLSYRQIALGAPFVEDQTEVGLYSLLIEYNPDTSVQRQVAYRSGFGTAVPAPAPADRLVLANDPKLREDDLREGRATFAVASTASRARVAYQTRDNWVQQLSVAANAYKPYGSGGGAEPWRDYVLGNDNYLYFHAGEAGKSISISYRTTDANGPLVDRPFVIDTQLVGANNLVPSAFSDGQVARVKLTDVNGGVLPDNTSTAPRLISIQAVRGTGMTVRTAYLNGDRYAQTLLTSSRGTN